MKTILLVDDNAVLRECFENELKRAGFRVISCGDAKSALAVQESYDAVMTDNDMPGMKGVDFIAALRDRGIWLPTVMVSGSVDSDISARVEKLKAKFFDKMEVRAAIKSLAGA